MSVSMRLVPVTPALLCQDRTGNCEEEVVKLTESPLTHSLHRFRLLEANAEADD